MHVHAQSCSEQLADNEEHMLSCFKQLAVVTELTFVSQKICFTNEAVLESH